MKNPLITFLSRWFRPHPLYRVQTMVQKLVLDQDGNLEYGDFRLNPEMTGAITGGYEIDEMFIQGDLLSYLAHTGQFPGLYLKSIFGKNRLIPTRDSDTLVFAAANAFEISLQDAAWLLLEEKYPGGMTKPTILARVAHLIKKYC